MSNRGFTLIELLVTLAVAIILVTVAVPGFQRLMVSNRLVADYNEVLAGLYVARSEAIKRRDEVSFEVISAAPWEYRVYRTAQGNTAADALRVGKVTDDSVSLSVTDGSIVQFDALGKIAEASDCIAGCEVTIKHRSGECRQITVNRFGRVGRGECSDE